MIIKEKKTPGQKLIKNMPLKTRWIITSAFSFFVVGFGLCFLLEAFYRLHNGFDKPTWIFLAVLSLIIMFSGMMIFSQSIVYHSEMRSRKIWKQKQKDLKKNRAQNRGNEKLNIQKSPQS